jgi:3-oxoacyl-[acyl-carrier protein] reductase
MMRKVFVTGGSKGIGKAVKEKLENLGYEVYAPSHKELDLSRMDSVEMFLEQHKNDVYDIIINNAGINDIHDIEDVTDEEIENAVQINLVSPLRILRTFVPAMKEQKYGRIVNIGSIWGIVSKRGRVVYSMTKHGIHGITKTLAVELAEYNILINTVCPGFTLTELTRKNNTHDQIAEISKEIPMKRMAEPDEIADVISYLVEERNTYMTGQMIAVDGGYTSK